MRRTHGCRRPRRPPPFSLTSVEKLWTDEHVSSQMLEHHLDAASDAASRSHAFIDASAAWICRHLAVCPDTWIADFGRYEESL